MTVIKTEESEEFTAESADQCCMAFVDGDASLREACEIDETSFDDLVYDEDNMCRLRTVTRTEFTLPDAMTLVKTEDEEFFTPNDRD